MEQTLYKGLQLLSTLTDILKLQIPMEITAILLITIIPQQLLHPTKAIMDGLPLTLLLQILKKTNLTKIFKE